MNAPRTPGRDWTRAAVLFALAFASTLYAGALKTDAFAAWHRWVAVVPEGARDLLPPWWTFADVWLGALTFNVPLLAILVAHEMGHWVTARRYGVDMSPPYLIPFVPPLGTLGAVIGLHLERIATGRLMRIAAFGPFAGMIVAVPVMALGLAWSEVQPLPEDFQGVILGESLGMKAMIAVIVGPIPDGHDVFLHPMAFAGWAGFFLTGFNLIPLGQLDGGHVAWALFGERFNRIAPVLWGVLVVLGALFYVSWLLLAGLLLVLIGIKHPPMSTDGVAQGGDRIIGVVAILLFILTFTPLPFPGLGFGLLNGG